MSQQLIRDGKDPDDWGALPHLIRGWFQEFNEATCIQKGLGGQSMNVWCALADKLRVIFNRADNEIIAAEFEAKEAAAAHDKEWTIKDILRSIEDRKPRRDPDHELLLQLRDVNAQEYGAQKIERFLDAARHLLHEAENVRRWHGNYTWRDNLDLDTICQPLEELGLFPRKRSAPQKPQAGRPAARWHTVGRDAAREIRQVAKQLGYSPTNYRDELGVTSYVSAKCINWAFNTDIESARFAEVMRKKFPKRPRLR